MFDINLFQRSFPSIQVFARAPLSRFTTFGLGGLAPYIISCAAPEELRQIVQFLLSNSAPHYLVIGEGSNLLVSDKGVDNIVIRYFSEKPSFSLSNNEITAHASSRLDDLAFFCAQQGLSGLGFASGIPGTIAGAISGNAGAFGQQVGQALKEVEILLPDGRIEKLTAKECGLAYRHSRFKNSREAILSAVFYLKNDSVRSMVEERDFILKMRKEKHPDYKSVPCAGSFFKNIASSDPNDRRQAAGWFLDQVGGKKMAVGGAGVFEKHANILIKKSKDCTADDVFFLSEKMKAAVFEKFHISLEREVRLIGEFDKNAG